MLKLQKGIEAQIDDEDIEHVSKLTWTFDGRYVVNNKRYGPRQENKKKKTYLHRHIMRLGSGRNPLVDHKDRDPLNNRKSNLRICSQVENQQNRKLASNNKSGVNGVNWFKPAGLWQAQVTYRGKHYVLGYSHNMDDCVKMRKEFDIKHRS